MLNLNSHSLIKVSVVLKAGKKNVCPTLCAKILFSWLKNLLNKQVLLWHQGISASLLKDAHMFHLD